MPSTPIRAFANFLDVKTPADSLSPAGWKGWPLQALSGMVGWRRLGFGSLSGKQMGGLHLGTINHDSFVAVVTTMQVAEGAVTGRHLWSDVGGTGNFFFSLQWNVFAGQKGRNKGYNMFGASLYIDRFNNIFGQILGVGTNICDSFSTVGWFDRRTDMAKTCWGLGA